MPLLLAKGRKENLYALRVFEESVIDGKSNYAFHVAYRYYAFSASPSTKMKLWRRPRIQHVRGSFRFEQTRVLASD